MPNRRGCVSTVTVPIARKLVWPKSFEALKFRPPDYFRRCLIESASNCYTDIGMRNLSLAEQHGSRGEIDFIHMDAHLAFLNIWVNIVGMLALTSVALWLLFQLLSPGVLPLQLSSRSFRQRRSWSLPKETVTRLNRALFLN